MDEASLNGHSHLDLKHEEVQREYLPPSLPQRAPWCLYELWISGTVTSLGSSHKSLSEKQAASRKLMKVLSHCDGLFATLDEGGGTIMVILVPTYLFLHYRRVEFCQSTLENF